MTDRKDGISARIVAATLDRSVQMQVSFSELEYAAKKKVTRRDRFLGEIKLIFFAPIVNLIKLKAEIRLN